MYPIARFTVAIVLATTMAPGENGWYMHVSLFAGEALGGGHACNLPHWRRSMTPVHQNCRQTVCAEIYRSEVNSECEFI